MKKRSRFSTVWRNVSLIFSERVDALCQWFRNIWRIWLARAEAWQAWDEHDKYQASLPDNEILAANEAFAYEDYLRVLESARIGRSARRLGIRISDQLYENVSCPPHGASRRCLTEDGLLEILPKIQAAARLRRQEIGFWVSLGIGLLGAVTGLVAVMG